MSCGAGADRRAPSWMALYQTLQSLSIYWAKHRWEGSPLLHTHAYTHCRKTCVHTNLLLGENGNSTHTCNHTASATQMSSLLNFLPLKQSNVKEKYVLGFAWKDARTCGSVCLTVRSCPSSVAMGTRWLVISIQQIMWKSIITIRPSRCFSPSSPLISSSLWGAFTPTAP